jgi:hypothetical protein
MRFLFFYASFFLLCFPVAGAQTPSVTKNLPDNYINGQELVPLIGDDLTAAFSGKTHYGTYKERRERTGTNQFRESTKSDGTTYYVEGDMKLHGQWRVFDEKICYQYDSTEVSGVHCFVIYEAGTCLYGYAPSATGPNGPINANYWTVKSIRKGDVSTCDDLIG